MASNIRNVKFSHDFISLRNVYVNKHYNILSENHVFQFHEIIATANQKYKAGAEYVVLNGFGGVRP